MRTALLIRVPYRIFALTAVLGATLAAQPAATFDVIIRGGTIVDGTGGAPYRADVGIVGKHIARIGTLAEDATTVLDARGLYVAPGFINLHSHASAAGLSAAENMLTQGVTLEILNADGAGPLDIGRQLADIAANGLAVNVGANAGFNSIWRSIVGDTNRRPAAGDVARMRELLVSNLEKGAWGVSAGLDYKPAYYSTTDEVIDVVSAARPWRTVFTNHDRITPESGYSSRVGMTETIAIGDRAGLIPLITHMKVQGREQGTAAAFLKTMTAATAEGRYVAADAYPYLAGQTSLAALIVPGWAQEGGRAQMLARFKDAELRAKIVAESEEAMSARFGGPQGVYMPALKRELTDVMKELGVSGGEAVVRVLEQQETGAILRFGLEEDLVRILQHPTTSIACDCGATPPGRGTHPRYYGTFPRALGRYVRETKALTWPDAIRKMTLLPAATIGLADRGAIAVGMAADITVFDPKAVIDHATYEQPTLASDGIVHVVVNGIIALRDGKATGQRGGAALARARHMPSRPLDLSGARRLVVSVPRGAEIEHPIRIDLTQKATDRRARGKLSAFGYEAVDFGILQTTGNWASITARARGEARTILVIVEAADPWTEDRVPTVTIWVEGATAPLRQRLKPGAVKIEARE
jgi:N-acyl-D-amino-acid deacylase